MWWWSTWCGNQYYRLKSFVYNKQFKPHIAILTLLSLDVLNQLLAELCKVAPSLCSIETYRGIQYFKVDSKTNVNDWYIGAKNAISKTLKQIKDELDQKIKKEINFEQSEP